MECRGSGCLGHFPAVVAHRKKPPSIPPSTEGGKERRIFRSVAKDYGIMITDLAHRCPSSGWFKPGTLVLTVSKGSVTRTSCPHRFAFREQVSPFDSPAHGAEYVPSPLTGRGLLALISRWRSPYRDRRAHQYVITFGRAQERRPYADRISDAVDQGSNPSP